MVPHSMDHIGREIQFREVYYVRTLRNVRRRRFTFVFMLKITLVEVELLWSLFQVWSLNEWTQIIRSSCPWHHRVRYSYIVFVIIYRIVSPTSLCLPYTLKHVETALKKGGKIRLNFIFSRDIDRYDGSYIIRCLEVEKQSSANPTRLSRVP